MEMPEHRQSQYQRTAGTREDTKEKKIPGWRFAPPHPSAHAAIGELDSPLGDIVSVAVVVEEIEFANREIVG